MSNQGLDIFDLERDIRNKVKNSGVDSVTKALKTFGNLYDIQTLLLEQLAEADMETKAQALMLLDTTITGYTIQSPEDKENSIVIINR